MKCGENRKIVKEVNAEKKKNRKKRELLTGKEKK